MIRIICITLLALCFIDSCENAPTITQPDPNEALINDFTSADWGTVLSAKEALESRQAEAIPSVLKILDRDEIVQLQNTTDLIYPGAKQFYGHGWAIDYDIDWLSVRAGWALEDLTFQNFGFRLTHSSTTPDVKKRLRAESVARAKTWWQNARSSWNRFDATVEALQSNDPARQMYTLGWLRYGKTKCDGLTIESFNRQLRPEAKRLSQSQDEGVRAQAKYLLEDKDGLWLKHKTESTLKQQ